VLVIANKATYQEHDFEFSADFMPCSMQTGGSASTTLLLPIPSIIRGSLLLTVWMITWTSTVPTIQASRKQTAHLGVSRGTNVYQHSMLAGFAPLEPSPRSTIEFAWLILALLPRRMQTMYWWMDGASTIKGREERDLQNDILY
jgi:hypothetical protein